MRACVECVCVEREVGGGGGGAHNARIRSPSHQSTNISDHLYNGV